MNEIAERLARMPPEERLYALRTLPAHLAGAGHDARLGRILTSLGFLQAKVEALGPEPLIADYALAPSGVDGLHLVQAAIRLAAHVLAGEPRQLYGQLAARLEGLESPAIRAILDEDPDRTWLRPRTRSLVLAGAALLRTLVGHTDQVYEIVVLPDGSGVVSASDDGTIVVWDVDAGVEIRRLGEPAPSPRVSGVTAAAILPDGIRLCTGRRNGTLELWDVKTGENVGGLPDQGSDIGAIAPFDDGRRLLTASMNGLLRVYDVASRSALHSHAVSYGTMTAAAIASGERIVYGAGSRGGVWDPHSGEDALLPLPDDCYVTSLVTLTSGHVLMASRDGFIRVVDAASRRVLRQTMVSFDAAVAAAAPLPDGRLVSATWDGHLRLWEAAPDRGRPSIDTGAGIRSLAVMPDGRRAITGGPDGVLRVWDLSADGSQERTAARREHEQAVYFLAVVDTHRAVSLAHDGALKVWSIADGRELLTFQLYDPVTARGAWSVALAGSRVVAASPNGEIASVVLKTEGALERWEGHRVGATALCTLPDGRRALSCGIAGDIRLWDVRAGTELFSFDISQWGLRRGLRIKALHPLSDGRLALAVFLERPIHLFEIASGTLLRTLPPGLDVHGCLPRDDAVLALHDGRWGIVDAKSGATRRTLAAPDQPVDEVAVAGSGGSAVTLFRSGRLELWRLEDGMVLCGFGADATLSACAIAADGGSVVAGDRTGRLHFLAVESGRRAHAQSGAGRTRAWWRFWSRNR